MKRLWPYLLGGLALLLLALVLLASRGGPLRRMDERITLRQQDKIPYGLAVAKHLLPSLFPTAVMEADARYPGTWDGLYMDRSQQAIILVADYLNAEEDELQRLGEFVEQGNSVFILARTFSDEASYFFGLRFRPYFGSFNSGKDSQRVKLERPFFAADSTFTYPGRRYDGFIDDLDTKAALVLGRNGAGHINFVRVTRGKGNFFIHTAPLAFSNYFILHKQNARYYQQAFSVLPQSTKTIVWNEYFLEKIRHSEDDNKETDWLATLFTYPSFKWGLLTAIATLALFVLLGMRRKQRMIPLYEKPTNESLDFVKTLGRLYYDRGDHKNLAEKMAAYFLEHVRSVYKLPSHTLDEEFVRTLHVKSGYPQAELEQITNTIRELPNMPAMSEEKLAQLHQQLELFYQNT